MADRRMNDWNIHPDAETLKYHLKQQETPKRSTVFFSAFCRERLERAKMVVDAGCGAGGPTAYLAKNYPNCNFLGIDESEALISIAKPTENLHFAVADLNNLDAVLGVDGVVLIQVLSWLEDYSVPLAMICQRLKPAWLAFSTLCYDGNIDCQITVNEVFRPRWSFYNIYSLPRLHVFMRETCGYYPIKQQPFRIDIDLDKPADPDVMGTYTLKLETGGRIQCSGPLMLPWYFVMYERGPDHDNPD
jgi:SAM-dependent methyltransferase